MKNYMTPQEASEYTGISRAKLAKLRHTGRGCPFIRIGESTTKALIRYRKQDLDLWMEQSMIQTTGGF